MKYKYLLENKYEQVSNLQKKSLNRNLSTAGTGEPASAGLKKNGSKSSKEEQVANFGGSIEETKVSTLSSKNK